MINMAKFVFVLVALASVNGLTLESANGRAVEMSARSSSDTSDVVPITKEEWDDVQKMKLKFRAIATALRRAQWQAVGDGSLLSANVTVGFQNGQQAKVVKVYRNKTGNLVTAAKVLLADGKEKTISKRNFQHLEQERQTAPGDENILKNENKNDQVPTLDSDHDGVIDVNEFLYFRDLDREKNELAQWMKNIRDQNSEDIVEKAFALYEENKRIEREQELLEKLKTFSEREKDGFYEQTIIITASKDDIPEGFIRIDKDKKIVYVDEELSNEKTKTFNNKENPTWTIESITYSGTVVWTNFDLTEDADLFNVLESVPVDQFTDITFKIFGLRPAIPAVNKHGVKKEKAFDDKFEHGAVLCVLYDIASETYGFADRKTRNWRYEYSALLSFLAIVLQFNMLGLLNEWVDDITAGGEEEDGDEEEVGWQKSFFVIGALVIFTYDVAAFLTGPSFRCLYALCNIDFRKHPYPVITFIVAWTLYLADLAVGVITFYLGVRYLANVDEKDDILLDSLALNFILEVDDYMLGMLKNFWSISQFSDRTASRDVPIPTIVILEYMPGKRGGMGNCLKVIVDAAKTNLIVLITYPPVLVAIAMVGYYLEVGFSSLGTTIAPPIMVGAGLLLLIPKLMSRCWKMCTQKKTSKVEEKQVLVWGVDENSSNQEVEIDLPAANCFKRSITYPKKPQNESNDDTVETRVRFDSILSDNSYDDEMQQSSESIPASDVHQDAQDEQNVVRSSRLKKAGTQYMSALGPVEVNQSTNGSRLRKSGTQFFTALSDDGNNEASNISNIFTADSKPAVSVFTKLPQEWNKLQQMRFGFDELKGTLARAQEDNQLATNLSLAHAGKNLLDVDNDGDVDADDLANRTYHISLERKNKGLNTWRSRLKDIDADMLAYAVQIEESNQVVKIKKQILRDVTLPPRIVGVEDEKVYITVAKSSIGKGFVTVDKFGQIISTDAEAGKNAGDRLTISTFEKKKNWEIKSVSYKTRDESNAIRRNKRSKDKQQHDVEQAHQKGPFVSLQFKDGADLCALLPEHFSNNIDFVFEVSHQVTSMACVNNNVVLEADAFDKFQHGAVLCMLYDIATETYGFSNRSTDWKYDYIAYLAITALTLQYILLYMLNEVLNQPPDPEDEDENVPAVYAIGACVLLVYDVVTFLTGPSFRCLNALCNIEFSKHPYPIITRVVAWTLYIADLGVGVITVTFGIVYLSNAMTKEEVLFNSLALNFIYQVDDIMLKMVQNYWSIGQFDPWSRSIDKPIPKKVILEYLPSKSDERKRIFYYVVYMSKHALKLCINYPAIPLITGIVGYYSVHGFYTLWSIILPPIILAVSLVALAYDYYTTKRAILADDEDDGIFNLISTESLRFIEQMKEAFNEIEEMFFSVQNYDDIDTGAESNVASVNMNTDTSHGNENNEYLVSLEKRNRILKQWLREQGPGDRRVLAECMATENENDFIEKQKALLDKLTSPYPKPDSRRQTEDIVMVKREIQEGYITVDRDGIIINVDESLSPENVKSFNEKEKWDIEAISIDDQIPKEVDTELFDSATKDVDDPGKADLLCILNALQIGENEQLTFKVTGWVSNEDCVNRNVVDEDPDECGVEFDKFDDGAVLCVLYDIASEAYGQTNKDDHWGWHSIAWLSATAITLQGAMLALLWQVVGEAEADANLADTQPPAYFVIAALVLFMYDAISFLTGSSFRCLIALWNIEFDRLPNPRFTRFVAWSLYLGDLIAGCCTVWLGVQFLALNGNMDKVLLDAIALHYIFEIDSLMLNLVNNYWSIGRYDPDSPILDAPIPKKVILEFLPSNKKQMDAFIYCVVVAFQNALVFCVNAPGIPMVLAMVGYYWTVGFYTFWSKVLPICIFVASIILVAFEWRENENVKRIFFKPPEELAQLEACLKAAQRRRDHDEASRIQNVLQVLGGQSVDQWETDMASATEDGDTERSDKMCDRVMALIDLPKLHKDYYDVVQRRKPNQDKLVEITQEILVRHVELNNWISENGAELADDVHVQSANV